MHLEAQKLSGGYGKTRVVQEIHLTLEPGKWLSLIGANGSGKSTVLKLLSRILLPQRGAVLLNGRDIHRQPAQAIAQTLALLPQQQAIPPGLTVQQLVSLGRTPYQGWWQWELAAEDRQQVEQALTQTQLQDFRDRPVEALSGGERQRAFLALALAQDPKILLLDEPTTYLDLCHQLELLELLKRLNQQQGLTIITVLHDINLAARYSDRLALLKEGCLYATGTPTKVLTPQTLADVFRIDATVLQTPVGLQIFPLAPIYHHSRDGPAVR
ncbi:MAG: ABC transporter ATP-binding protein [Thermosynechococcaceae cyanobacterium MS004]|nr:ABC transporter ATP-binding protein [Thermosynechococcaceae cyanobacterium MS004]